MTEILPGLPMQWNIEDVDPRRAPAPVRCRDCLEVRSIRSLGLSLAARSGDLQRLGNRLREPQRADGHNHAGRTHGVHGLGCRR